MTVSDDHVVEAMARAAYHSVIGFGAFDTVDYKEPDHWPNVGTSVDAEGYRSAARAALDAYRKCLDEPKPNPDHQPS